MSALPRVTIWNEYRHERQHEGIANIYPKGIHGAIGDYLLSEGFSVRSATLDEPEHGLTEQLLSETDVLIWWGHAAHDEVSEEIVKRVVQRVMDGMGFLPLHSAHFSKIFKRLMGTSCDLKWREAGEKERLWVVSPGHPIASGLPDHFDIPHAEMYGEHFDVPQPDQLVFVSWFQGGEVFRSGCCFYRGRGKIFYFRPGHETYPIFHQAEVLQVISNGIKWAAPSGGPPAQYGHHPEPLEEIVALEPVADLTHPELN